MQNVFNLCEQIKLICFTNVYVSKVPNKNMLNFVYIYHINFRL